MELGGFGRFLVMAGIVLVLVGALLTFAPRIPWLGRLPGDFSFGGPGWRVYVPLGTMLLINLLLALVLWLWNRR